MKQYPLLAAAFLFIVLNAEAEVRTFTNAAGKKLEAELVGMEGETAVLKMGNGRSAKVPLASLSAEDQTYAKAWWEENKNKVMPSDLRLTIKKESKRVKEEDSEKKAKNNTKVSKTATTWTCKIENLSTKSIEGLKADYTIYEKVSERTEEGSDNRTEETSNSAEVGSLKPNGTIEFTTEAEISEDSETKSKDGSSSRRESIVGVVVTLVLDGKEILKQGDPERLLEQLADEAKRKEATEKKSE